MSRRPEMYATDSVCAMTIATLESAAAQSDQVPIWALINTSEENLRGRAERLATRLSAVETIQTCQITAEDARLTPDGRWRLPSRQIRVRHMSTPAAQWAEDLLGELPALLVAPDGDDIVLDLRWISASDDGKLAELLGGDLTMPASE